MSTAPDSETVRDLLRFIEGLSDLSGRTAGSEAERICQERLAGDLHRVGLDATVEGAVCPPPEAAVLLLHALVLGLGCFFVFFFPLWALAWTALGALSFWGELRGYPRVLRRLLPRRISGNLVARLPNPEAAGKIVLIAHADTAGSSALFHPIVKTWFRRREQLGRNVHPGLLVLFAAAAQAAAALLVVLGLGGGLPGMLVSGAAVVHVGMAVLAVDWIRSPPVEGAVDNGSGLAVVRNVARQIAETPLQHSELWVVASGDREPDAGGIQAFLRRFSRVLDKETTLFINVDDVGRGLLHYAVSEGRWERVGYRPTLPALAEKLATRPEFAGVRSVGFVGTTDAGPVTREGYRAVTLTTLVGGIPAEVLHTARDTIDAVEPRALARAYDFTLGLVRETDAWLGESRGQVPEHVGAAPTQED